MDFVGSLNLIEEIGRLEPSFDDEISGLLLSQMGSVGKSCRREAQRAGKKLLSELYSPPRVTELLRRARSRNLLPGCALDLTVVDPEDGMPWDFSLRHKRDRARQIIREQRPYMLIGSPPCTKFSTWQFLNWAKSKDRPAMDRARAAAEVHLNFVAELYQEQMDGGRYFLHEHPMYATSWQVASIASICQQPGVQRVQGDQCQYGAEARSGPGQGQPILKPTGFMTNSPMVARALSQRCTGRDGMCSRAQGGQHHPCSGKHAREAAKYPRQLCRAMLRGVRDQMRADDLLKSGCFGVQARDDDAEVERQMRGPAQGYSGKYRDDLTGQVLRDVWVEAARATELA